MKIILATRNAGKIREIGELFPHITFLPPAGEAPDETGSTFEENARIKARAAGGEYPALADDSGLCADALGGKPGVYSARYGGWEKLLREMRGIENRRARFECVFVLAYPDGREVVSRGTCEGVITDAPRGAGGFGFDPVFELPDGRTMAELPEEEKNKISHRAIAAKGLTL